MAESDVDDPKGPNGPAGLRAAWDTLSVRRVFGEPYEVGSTTIIPVASVQGGGGGGTGEGNTPDGKGAGSGSGMGFGMKSRPVGVYVVKDGSVEWVPSVDVTRIVVGGLLLSALAVVSLRRVLVKRS